jgi:hypothetical protein
VVPEPGATPAACSAWDHVGDGDVDRRHADHGGDEVDGHHLRPPGVPCLGGADAVDLDDPPPPFAVAVAW